jgi:methyl-accepting chemotaxis protein
MLGFSIRTALVSLFGLMGAMIAAQGLLAIVKISSVDASMVDIATHWMQSVDSAREIYGAVSRYQIADARFVMSNDDAGRAEAENGAAYQLR